MEKDLKWYLVVGKRKGKKYQLIKERKEERKIVIRKRKGDGDEKG